MSTKAITPPPAAPAAAANISVADLATMFKRQPAAPAAPSQPAPSAAAPPEESEQALEETAETELETQETETQEASRGEREGSEEGEGETGEAATGETEEESTETAQPENTETAETQPAALPTELAEAIAELKADGKGGQAKLLKRLHTVVDQRDTERNRRLEAEQLHRETQEQLEKIQASGTSDRQPAQPQDLVDVHPDVAPVVQAIADVDRYIAWCKTNKDGGEVDDGRGGKTYLDAEAVATILDNARNRRTELVAVKAQRAESVRNATKAAYQKFHTEAVKAYPWMEKRESAERQELDLILNQAPWLKQFPNHELFLADMFRGRAMRESAGKTPVARPMVKPKGGNIPAKVVAEPSAARPTVDPKKKDVKASEESFEQSGRTDDLAKTFAAKRRAQRGR